MALSIPRSLNDGPVTLRVSVEGQRLEVLRGGRVIRDFPVSTSRFGVGFEPGSFKTPLGRFAIVEKIGEGAIAGTVFRGRVDSGQRHEGGGDEDAILTRILWLGGLDPDNANTRGRFIYIHGTNQEDLIGQPASHGCVRMRNADIIELFDLVREGTRVEIVEAPPPRLPT